MVSIPQLFQGAAGTPPTGESKSRLLVQLTTFWPHRRRPRKWRYFPSNARSFKSTAAPAPAHAHTHAHAHCLSSRVSLQEPTTSVRGNPNHREGPCTCPSCPCQPTARVEPEWISLKLSQPRPTFFQQRLHAWRGDEPPSSESTSPPRLRNRQQVSDGLLLFEATNIVTSGCTEEETWCNRFYVLKW